MHENERTPVYTMKEFIQEQNIRPVDHANLQIDYLFLVPPTDLNSIKNITARTKKINTDFTDSETQEPEIVGSNFRQKDYSKIFDFHESGSKRFFLREPPRTAIFGVTLKTRCFRTFNFKNQKSQASLKVFLGIT